MDVKLWIACPLLTGLIALGVYKDYTYNTQYETVVTRIVSTDTKRESKHRDQYLVYTDNEVFQNVDTAWHQKYDSSDVQNQLIQNQGKVCNLEVTGFRNPYYSIYRNIISVSGCTDAK